MRHFAPSTAARRRARPPQLARRPRRLRVLKGLRGFVAMQPSSQQTTDGSEPAEPATFCLDAR
eukprot:4717812-Pleurochrysis_carterae.AAC.1